VADSDVMSQSSLLESRHEREQVFAQNKYKVKKWQKNWNNALLLI
jgi:hypothetical protein